MADITQSAFSDMSRCEAEVHISMFPGCWACRQILHEDRWAKLLYCLTFRCIDRRIKLSKAWARHQELFNAK